MSLHRMCACASTLPLLALLLAVPLAGPASAGDRWLHVQIDEEEGRGDGDHVRLQLPLEMIQAVLPMIDTDELHDGRVRVGGEDLDAAELRAVLAAVKEAEDGEYVRVESESGTVRVAKRGGALRIRVAERDGWGDADDVVRIRVPMRVVEAMLGGDPDEIDLVAGIEALGGLGQVELVTVDDGDSRVRIWIDARQERLDGDDHDDDRGDDAESPDL